MSAPENVQNVHFTDNGWDNFQEVVDSPDFFDKSADIIYEMLLNNINVTPFNMYLKRYLYYRVERTETFDAVSDEVYKTELYEAFENNNVPGSFEPTTAKLRVLINNWLKQHSVSRKTVLILGFGLQMTVDDVNELLTKAIQERELNPKDPFEVICWYCYKNELGYNDYQNLWDRYLTLPDIDIETEFDDNFPTVRNKNMLLQVADEKTLLQYLNDLRKSNTVQKSSISAKKWFDRLFLTAKEIVVDIYNNSISAAIDKIIKDQKEYEISDITEADLERIISCAIPTDGNGNLSKAKASTLYRLFEGKRFNRQHIGEINMGKAEVNRFDFITLNFFIYSQKEDDSISRNNLFYDFYRSTNSILEECLMGEININNPYECFVLMCMASDSPLSTYADVWGRSYQIVF